MNKSESLGKLALALAKAQGEMKNAVKDSANPYFKSKYADLTSVWEACRAVLAKNELSICQTPCGVDGKMRLETILLHSSGEYLCDVFELNPTKNDPQGFGSALTYARRYALAAFVGVATEDDDGNAASEPKDIKCDYVSILNDTKRMIYEMYPKESKEVLREILCEKAESRSPKGIVSRPTLDKLEASPELIKIAYDRVLHEYESFVAKGKS